jgi:hydrogenase-4 membrane subunit HyfE
VARRLGVGIELIRVLLPVLLARAVDRDAVTVAEEKALADDRRAPTRNTAYAMLEYFILAESALSSRRLLQWRVEEGLLLLSVGYVGCVGCDR